MCRETDKEAYFPVIIRLKQSSCGIEALRLIDDNL